jgi:hypothetical protein
MSDMYRYSETKNLQYIHYTQEMSNGTAHLHVVLNKLIEGSSEKAKRTFCKRKKMNLQRVFNV